MPTHVSIVIPAFNQLDCCRQCIDSVLANTDYPYKLLLVDNGSTDGVSEYFDSIPDATVIHSETNLGFPAGANLGLTRADGHVLLLNSDTIVPPGWLSRLVSALESNRRIGMAGPMSNNVSGPQHLPDARVNNTGDLTIVSETLWRDYAASVDDLERIVGFCMLISEPAFKAIGLLDESFGIGNLEDDDYCLRVKKAGYRVCMAKGCFVFHYGSRTFQAMGFTSESYRELIHRNESLFNGKWGLDHGQSRTGQLARRRLHEAQSLQAAGELKGAVACLAESIAIDPSNPDAFNLLGLLLLAMGEPDKAVRQFDRALALDPGHAEALSNRHGALDSRD